MTQTISTQASELRKQLGYPVLDGDGHIVEIMAVFLDYVAEHGHANLLEGLMGEGLGAFLAHPELQHLAAYLETPGPDRSGPDRDEIRKLRELHARWQQPAGRDARGISRRGSARRP